MGRESLFRKGVLILFPQWARHSWGGVGGANDLALFFKLLGGVAQLYPAGRTTSTAETLANTDLCPWIWPARVLIT